MEIYKTKPAPWITIWFRPAKTLEYVQKSEECGRKLWVLFYSLVPIQIISVILRIFYLLPDKKLILFLREPSEYLYAILITPIVGCLYLYLGCWMFCRVEKIYNNIISKRTMQIIVLWSSIIPLTVSDFLQGIMIWVPTPFSGFIYVFSVVFLLVILLSGTIAMCDISNGWNAGIYLVTIGIFLVYRFIILTMLASDYTTIWLKAL